MNKNDALFYIGQDFEGLVFRAMERGLTIDEILAEVKYQVQDAEKNKGEYE